MNIISFPTGMFSVNTYIISNGIKECIIIDPGGSFDMIKKRMEKHKLEPKHVLLTHGHFDHIGALNEIREQYDVNVYAHKMCSRAITDSRLNISDFAAISREKVICEPAENIIEDNQEFNLCNLNINAIYTPGHSLGSMVYIIEDCAFTGDVLFRLSIGRTDFLGGSMELMKESLDRLKTILKPENRILPGHNDESIFSYELENNPYL